MNLGNILLQVAVDADTTQTHLHQVTGAVKEGMDSIVANPGEHLSVTKIAETMTGIDWNGLINTLTGYAVSLCLRVVAALLVLFIGRLIIKKVCKIFSTILAKKNVDQSLSTFSSSVLRISMMTILFITVIAVLGIETSSFIAIFASAGVAVGLALSGTLQNFAGGVLILILKPYKIGDFIEADGVAGTVKEILIFNTVIITPNNERIIIPNGGLSTNTIKNYSSEQYRRVEWRVGITYGNNVEVARKVILEILESDPHAMRDEYHIPTVALESLDDSAVTLVVRGFATAENYWPVFYRVNERIYNELPKHGISFPYPQLDVHIEQS